MDKIVDTKNKTLQKVLNSFELIYSNNHKMEDLEAFSKCESYRRKLLADKSEVSYEFFSSEKKATVQNVCKEEASKIKWCQFLYYLTKSIKNPNVLEIGTNLGVSGSYILEALKGRNGNLTTMEGLPQFCEMSTQQFSSIVPNSNFEVVEGLYDITFPKIIERRVNYNLLFLDGNHSKEPTLEYFRALKSKIGHSAIFVFDDIYWSKGMEEAWGIIKNDKDVNFSLDLYQQGVAVIDKRDSQDKKQFNLHFAF